jgi:outer membrane biogenesis lipoprotein LolB
MKNSHLFIILSWTILFASCQSLKKEEAAPVIQPAVAVGQWEAKAMIKSLETGEASVVSLDVVAQKPSPMRVEVTTSLGLALASVIVKDSEIEYVVPKQKKYYKGPMSNNALEPILKIKVDPRLFVAAFFEEPYPAWTCKAENGHLVACSTPDGVEMKWNREDPKSTRISLSSPIFDVQVQIKKFTAKSELPKSALLLKIPESFKKIQLN